MRINSIQRLLANLFRDAQLQLPHRTNSQSDKLNLSRAPQSIPGNHVTEMVDKLISEEASLLAIEDNSNRSVAGSIQLDLAARNLEVILPLHKLQESTTAARCWESDYDFRNVAERHPENRFREGRAEDGTPLYSSADHYARAFVPNSDDYLNSIAIEMRDQNDNHIFRRTWPNRSSVAIAISKAVNWQFCLLAVVLLATAIVATITM